MALLLLKLTMSPLLIAGASQLARRFGPTVGGWMIGLPVTAGPVALFVVLDHGAAFAARMSTGFVAGVSAQAAFAVAYASLARRGVRRLGALSAGTAAFAVTGLTLATAHLALPLLVAIALTSLLVGLRLVPAGPGFVPTAPTRRDLALRVAAATGLVLIITTFASALGPSLSGVVTTFPLLSTILAMSVHRTSASSAALVYRGLLVGLFALSGFAATLSLVLAHASVATAFALALALTFLIQMGSLLAIRRSSEVRA